MLALASLEVAGKDEKRKDEGPDENRVAAQPGGQLFRCSVGLLTHWRQSTRGYRAIGVLESDSRGRGSTESPKNGRRRRRHMSAEAKARGSQRRNGGVGRGWRRRLWSTWARHSHWSSGASVSNVTLLCRIYLV